MLCKHLATMGLLHPILSMHSTRSHRAATPNLCGSLDKTFNVLAPNLRAKHQSAQTGTQKTGFNNEDHIITISSACYSRKRLFSVKDL